MEKISFDYSKLAGRIKEKFWTQKAFADALGVTETTLSNKITGIYYFTQEEIEKSCKLLDIAPADVFGYFFTVRVEKPKIEKGE